MLAACAMRPTLVRSLAAGHRAAVAAALTRAGPAATAAAPAGAEELRKLMRDTIASDAATFAGFIKTEEMDMAQFAKLVNLIVPDMGKEEAKALFTSMANDGSIQDSEIFCDLSLQILHNRMNQKITHPLEGSYHCLPRPPFYSDPVQLKSIETLKVIFDEVVAAHGQPVPQPSPPPKPKAAQAQSGGLFSSMFGGVRKTKAPPMKEEKAVEWVPTPNAPKGAYLHGGCGCGKTVLLDLFFRSLPEGFTARRLHWHEFIRDAFRSMQGQPPGENVFAAIADMLSKQFRVLLLDELLITHISEAILVKNLFRHMWARGMTIITTSNYLPEELYSKGFNRDQFEPFLPELTAQCHLIKMGGDTDYRKVDANSNKDIFFHPVNAETTAAFNVVFEQTVPEVERDALLPIPKEKRNIKIPARGMDIRGASVARFTFNDLCATNMGRADYALIAEKYHTLFIEDVPKFKADLGAEFRRFVTLTDTLYGKKVAVFLQSEVHTDQLFADGLLSADIDVDELWSFRRCSSMLCEMQNPKYHHMVWLMRNHMLQETALHLL